MMSMWGGMGAAPCARGIAASCGHMAGAGSAVYFASKSFHLMSRSASSLVAIRRRYLWQLVVVRRRLLQEVAVCRGPLHTLCTNWSAGASHALQSVLDPVARCHAVDEVLRLSRMLYEVSQP